MSTYGDAFAITPQRSLPREKVAQMLERISQRGAKGDRG